MTDKSTDQTAQSNGLEPDDLPPTRPAAEGALPRPQRLHDDIEPGSDADATPQEQEKIGPADRASVGEAGGRKSASRR